MIFQRDKNIPLDKKKSLLHYCDTELENKADAKRLFKESKKFLKLTPEFPPIDLRSKRKKEQYADPVIDQIWYGSVGSRIAEVLQQPKNHKEFKKFAENLNIREDYPFLFNPNPAPRKVNVFFDEIATQTSDSHKGAALYGLVDLSIKRLSIQRVLEFWNELSRETSIGPVEHTGYRQRVFELIKLLEDNSDTPMSWVFGMAD